MRVDDNQQAGKIAKVVGFGKVMMYPDNCIVVPRNDIIEMLKALDGLKKKLQPLLK